MEVYRSSPESITATRRLEDGGGTQRALRQSLSTSLGSIANQGEDAH